MHESIPIYSGGLGVLAGDDIKSASDLDIPLVGGGGFRALKAMGITPGVLHMNEGQSAFAVLEAIRDRIEKEGLGFDQAASRVSRQVVFTTHTPVPAGHDRFNSELIEKSLGVLRQKLGLSHESLMVLGRENPGNPYEEFCMTVLALKLSRRANAVSALHGEVSRAMWTGLYPGKSEETVPIGHITPMEFMSLRGWRHKCVAFLIGIWAAAGTNMAPARASGRGLIMWTTASFGKLT